MLFISKNSHRVKWSHGDVTPTFFTPISYLCLIFQLNFHNHLLSPSSFAQSRTSTQVVCAKLQEQTHHEASSSNWSCVGMGPSHDVASVWHNKKLWKVAKCEINLHAVLIPMFGLTTFSPFPIFDDSLPFRRDYIFNVSNLFAVLSFYHCFFFLCIYIFKIVVEHTPNLIC